MKGLIILAVIIVLIGGGIWMGVMKSTMSDQGAMFLVVMGNPKEKTIEFAVSIEMVMANHAKVRLDRQMNPLWDEWIDKHFEMRDAAGEKAPFIRVAHTLLVDENKVKHLPEFYIQYEIRKGEPYSLDYISSTEKKTRYRYEFTSATETKKPERVNFAAVEGK